MGNLCVAPAPTIIFVDMRKKTARVNKPTVVKLQPDSPESSLPEESMVHIAHG